MTAGMWRERFPYVRVGDGGTPIVLLPGLSLRNGVPGAITAKGYASAFGILAANHTLYFIQRPRGLPAGATTRDIAGEYADLIAAELGQVDLIGMSTGGLIAQHLADRPDLVRSLTMVLAGPRLSASGVDICRHFQELAAAGRWRALHGDLAAKVVDGRTAQWAARLLLTAFGTKPSSTEAADFAITVDAVLAHDGTAALAGAAMPLLMILGETDPFFDPAPGAVVYAGAGHGLAKSHPRRLQNDIAAFLGRRISA
jgi:pimeloyl-ACP methyl ester carboxylesterase